MEETRNTTVVQEAYAAFSRGDIQTLLSTCADDIVWNGVYGTAAHVPTSGERRGKAAVAEFFKQVAENINFLQFEPKEFIATGDTVVALGHYIATTPMKKSFESDFAMGVHAAQRARDALSGILQQRGDQCGLRRQLAARPKESHT